MVARLKVQYCKVIVLTSLVWVLLDVCLLTYYTDCMMNSQSQASCNSGVRERKSTGYQSTVESQGFFGRLLPGGLYMKFENSLTCDICYSDVCRVIGSTGRLNMLLRESGLFKFFVVSGDFLPSSAIFR